MEPMGNIYILSQNFMPNYQPATKPLLDKENAKEGGSDK